MNGPNESAPVDGVEKYLGDLRTEGEKKKHAKLLEKWDRFDIGDVVVISGVPCTLTNVNIGRRRLTFTPHPKAKMPRGRSGGVVGPVRSPSTSGPS